MNRSVDEGRLVVGLVGFRCCGKSTIRSLLDRWGYPSFDTNSVRTGDLDANTIALDEILTRYGRGESYLYFVEPALRDFVSSQRKPVFIDSLKVAADADVLQAMFAGCRVEIWYVHASLDTRKKRYFERDVERGMRQEPIENHDATLERYGIVSLIKRAVEVINTEHGPRTLRTTLRGAIRRAVRRGAASRR